MRGEVESTSSARGSSDAPSALVQESCASAPISGMNTPRIVVTGERSAVLVAFTPAAVLVSNLLLLSAEAVADYTPGIAGVNPPAVLSGFRWACARGHMFEVRTLMMRAV